MHVGADMQLTDITFAN